VAFERLRDPDFDPGMGSHQLPHQRGEIPLEMDSESQEIRNHKYVPDALRGQPRDRAGKFGLPQLQKCRFHVLITSGASKCGCDVSNAFIGGFDARAMRKNDESALLGQRV
jgi:hypothetical protein